jgi:hypothetical protein
VGSGDVYRVLGCLLLLFVRVGATFGFFFFFFLGDGGSLDLASSVFFVFSFLYDTAWVGGGIHI